MENLTKGLRFIEDYRKVIEDLHKNWKPHPAQIKIGRAVFNEGKRLIFCQCGRRFGKTEVLNYIMWRRALTVPGSACYIILPQRKQAQEILWASKRLQNFGPRGYLPDSDEQAFNKSELRVVFKNGSFIKLEGADNPDALRGITPDLVGYDEFKEFSEEFHVAMEPSFLTKKTPLVIIGTPPDRQCFYTKMMEWSKRESRRQDSGYSYFQFPTASNDRNDPEELARIKKKLIDGGEESVWRREYMAEYVPGGVAAIFPAFSHQRHVKPRDYLLKILERDKKKLDWYVICDPGTTTCFAVMFAAINRYTGQIFILDEIYEKDRTQTSTDVIWNRIVGKRTKLYDDPDKWRVVYDEAAAWFANEVISRYQVNISPTHKAYGKKADGISLAKDVMRANNCLFVAAECPNFVFEIENYVSDADGDFPKKDDHLIDTFRYLLLHSGFELTQDPEYVPLRDKRERKIIEETRKDWDKMRLENDMFALAEQPTVDEDGFLWIM